MQTREKEIRGMSASQTGVQFPSEVVGVIATRDQFEAAVQALLAASFERSDLSVLASHDSIDAAGKSSASWRDALSGIVGELKYEGPLIASGAIVLAGGPVAATVAGLLGAAVGGIAIRDILQEITARPHTEEFARSLATGSVILWVNVPSAARMAEAMSLLERCGARNVHLAERQQSAVV